MSDPSTVVVVYVSFGSWLSAEHLPNNVQSIFENVVRRLVTGDNEAASSSSTNIKVIFKRGKTDEEKKGEISVFENMDGVYVKKW